MTKGAATPRASDSSPAPAAAPPAGGDETLCDTVRSSVRQYLTEIDGELPTDFYQLVLSQVEAPLLEEIMRHTRNNQTRAAHLLGLNRGTLRKKLRQYGIAGDH